MAVTGNPNVQEQPTQRTWTLANGWRTVRVFRGRRAQIEALIPQFIFTAAEMRQTDDTPFCNLEVTFPDLQDGSNQANQDANVNPIWTLQGNDLEKTIYAHPNVKTLGLKILVAIRHAVSSTDDYDKQVAAVTAAVGTDTSKLAPALLLLESLINGIDSYPVPQFVLRKTVVISAGSSIKPAIDRIGYAFTTVALQAAEAIPGTINFSLPAGWWAKRTPTVAQQSNGKFEVTQEYWHADEISNLVYPNQVTS